VKPQDRLLRDYVEQVCRVKDPRILNAVRRVLSAKEKTAIEPHVSVVTGEKVMLVVRRPEQLKKILIMGSDPGKIYCFSLRLNRKQNGLNP
jgi:hypothetical protein